MCLFYGLYIVKPVMTTKDGAFAPPFADMMNF